MPCDSTPNARMIGPRPAPDGRNGRVCDPCPSRRTHRRNARCEQGPRGCRGRGAEGTRSGYLRDYISGIEVRATPEEVDTVQVFARRLVDDLGYDSTQLQTRPKHRVRR
jgi:hypothetical protein